MTLQEIYEQKCNEDSDIFQHLPTLRKYAEQSDRIIELGVRSIVSTWAFLIGMHKWMISLDIKHPSKYLDYDPNGCNLELVYEIAKENGIYFEFIEGDSVTTELPVCDLMFFDTLHTREQLTKEVVAHSGSVQKYMIFHDTVSYENELMPVIRMVEDTGNWHIEETYLNNNGLIIMKRND